MQQLDFEKVHVAAYSPRPGTIAYRQLEDDVPQDVKQARFHAIDQLQQGVSARINSRLLGADVEVLVEGTKRRPAEPSIDPRPSTLDPELVLSEAKEPSTLDPRPSTLSWYGRTRQNRLVHFAGAAQPGDLVRVRIEHAGPWALVGTAVASKTKAASGL